MNKDKWIEMSYYKYSTLMRVSDRLWNESHCDNNGYVINKILEYRLFDEDDYSEDSKA